MPMGMQIAIAVPGEDLFAMRAWLELDPALTGAVRLGDTEIEPGAMGDLGEVLVVVMGAGGMATVLANNLTSWLATRKSEVTITRTAADGATATVTIKDVKNAEKIVTAFLADD
jgi:hypothetical protein